MPTMRDKVRGMMLGIGIGDALGLVVETWSKERIKDTYPEGIRDYKVPKGHKWYKNQLAGTWTDDTQLTIATAKGLMERRDFDLDIQAKHMVLAMKEAMKGAENVGGSGVPGWGYTTVRAVRLLANNVPWDESGKAKDPNLGHGNGVVMRQSPIAAMWATNRSLTPDVFYQNLINFSAMTHYTQQSAIATLVHNEVLTSCLFIDPSIYHVNDLIDNFEYAYHRFNLLNTDHLVKTPIDMWEQFAKITESKGWDADKIIATFGGGSCNVGHSLPFCYAFWVNNHDNVQLLFDVIEAGGDTDTNASIVGSMLGALHGKSIFPRRLVNGLVHRDEILTLADDFCDKFEIA
jgi:ADP-ribosyl-[dinitrogen reductase] hydrolase